MRIRPTKKQAPRFQWVNLVLFLLIVSITAASFYLFSSYFGNTTPINKNNATDVIPLTEDEIPLVKWWDMTWKQASRLKVINPTYEDISEGAVARFTFDHKTIALRKQSRTDGADIMILYQDKDNNFFPLNYEVSDVNTERTTVSFKTMVSIPKRYATGRYFLYYGNNSQKANKYQSKTPSIAATSLISEINEALNPVFSLSIGRKWYLKGDDMPKDYKTINASIRVGSEYKYDDRAVIGQVVDTKLQTAPVIIKDDSAFLSLDISSLNPGEYKFKIKIDTYEDFYDFKVSYPVYATWTMDWEGYDVKDQYLADIDELANENGMPVTHYFNPRIFVTSSISDSRRKYLTNWVLERKQTRGDEIGMHLHMFYDFVEAAGVARRTEASWEPGSKEGYEVLTSSYTPEEFEKLVSYGLTKFKENNLPAPSGYRAGGWFINLDNLKVLPKLGFKYDSSGRSAYTFGRNNIKGFWDLKSTTQPYKISESGQNVNTPPQINLWEFPDNGADSTNLDSKEMIQRFNDNFNGSYLNERKVVTFLSHPHWFNLDKPRMQALFSEIGKYNARTGNGPVVYTTIDKIYPVLAK